MLLYNGMPVQVSHWLVDNVRRSWKERLFTRPWRPWVTTKQVPSKDMYNLNGRIIIHPAMLEHFKYQLTKYPKVSCIPDRVLDEMLHTVKETLKDDD